MDRDEEARRVEEAAAGSTPAGEDEDWEMSSEPAAAGEGEQPAAEPQEEPAASEPETEPITDGGGAMPPGAEPVEEPVEPDEGKPGPAPEPDVKPSETTIRKVTEYVVLVEQRVKMGEEPVVMWREVGTFAGPKALDSAHRTFEGQEHGALVAVPTRSWKPKRPKPKPPKEPAVELGVAESPATLLGGWLSSGPPHRFLVRGPFFIPERGSRRDHRPVKSFVAPRGGCRMPRSARSVGGGRPVSANH